MIIFLKINANLFFIFKILFFILKYQNNLKTLKTNINLKNKFQKHF
jgi:hypothetical protein